VDHTSSCDDRRVTRTSRAVGATRQQLAAVALPVRFALVGALAAGVLGGVVGLVIGLRTYAPTAWFAVLEIGVPAAVLGLVLGLVVGCVTGLVGQHRPLGRR